VLFTFYIQCVLKLKKKSGAKGLNTHSVRVKVTLSVSNIPTVGLITLLNLFFIERCYIYTFYIFATCVSYMFRLL